VLCGLVPREAGLAVVLTRRAAHLRHHAGQISFPGGKVEPWDASASSAALREAEEEIGLRPAEVRLLGHYDPYTTVTRFRVTPFVGVVDPGWRARLDPNEVDAVFEAPLDFLMDPRNCERRHYEREGERRHFYAMPWGEHMIWGATAGMLKGLSDRIRRLGRVVVE
jgi:8-oxo-dGTP pyrophosphatase MutT (NUDIX family)